MTSQTLDKTSDGTTVAVKVGSPIVIQLEGNPTTGYSWIRSGYVSREKSESLSCEHLQVESKYVADKVPAGMCGGGGVFNITVTPLTAGTHELKMVYARVWEGEDSTAESYAVKLSASA